MDENYRRLQRLAQTGDLQAKVDLFKARVRMGEIDYDRAVALSVFKHRIASLAFPNSILSEIQDPDFACEIYGRWIIAILDHTALQIQPWDISTTLQRAKAIFYGQSIAEHEMLAGIFDTCPLFIHINPIASTTPQPPPTRNTISFMPAPRIHFLKGLVSDLKTGEAAMQSMPDSVIVNACDCMFFYTLVRRVHPQPFSTPAISAFSNFSAPFEQCILVFRQLLRMEHHLPAETIRSTFAHIVDTLGYVADIFHPSIVREVLEFMPQN